jgi:hypothetical protein
MRGSEAREEESTTRELWEKITSFEEGQARLWHIGAIRFWIRRVTEEWFIAFEETGEYRAHPAAGEEGEPPPELKWNRYVAGKTAKIIVHPVLPDRPIVIKPTSPVKILPDRGSRYFIHVPVWISIMEGSSKNPLLLEEHPGDFLSSTWFGDPDDGELCFSFTSDLYKNPAEREDLPLMAVCPLNIRNGFTSILDFQRICVRVPHLQLYSGPRYLCTNEVELIYRGAGQQSHITFRESAPTIEPDLKRIALPRIPVNRNIIKKSFEYIKSLSLY